MHLDYSELDVIDSKGNFKEKAYRPLIQIKPSKRGFMLFNYICLIDSGADDIIFPLDLALAFKLKVKKFPTKISNTAGGGQIILYEIPYQDHKIDLILEDGTYVKETICFTTGQQMPLLGQDYMEWSDHVVDQRVMNARWFPVKYSHQQKVLGRNTF